MLYRRRIAATRRSAATRRLASRNRTRHPPAAAGRAAAAGRHRYSATISESVGHSDADVLLHAVTDALLGAAALGDIGQMFPDTDPANRGRDSAEMLAAASAPVRAGRLADRQHRLHRLRPAAQAARPTSRPSASGWPRSCGIESERVGLKAKTGEGIGPIGREEAIAAQCVALLREAMLSRSTSRYAECRPNRNPHATAQSIHNRLSHAIRVYNTLSQDQGTLRAGRGRARSASISAGRRSTSPATSATWSGR